MAFLLAELIFWTLIFAKSPRSPFCEIQGTRSYGFYSIHEFDRERQIDRGRTASRGRNVVRGVSRSCSWGLDPWQYIGWVRECFDPLNVTFFFSELLLDNSAFHIIKNERLLSKTEGKTNLSRCLELCDGIDLADLSVLRKIYANEYGYIRAVTELDEPIQKELSFLPNPSLYSTQSRLKSSLSSLRLCITCSQRYTHFTVIDALHFT